jgi:hypothetical protein
MQINQQEALSHAPFHQPSHSFIKDPSSSLPLASQQRRMLAVVLDGAARTKRDAREAGHADSHGTEEQHGHDDEGKDPLQGGGDGDELLDAERCVEENNRQPADLGEDKGERVSQAQRTDRQNASAQSPNATR